MSGIIKPTVGAQLKLDHPLSRGLVGCWLLNENNGNKAHDYSGQGNVGTLTNMDPATDWVGSPDGGALDFDGSDDYIECADSPSLNITKSITISAWINFAVTGNPVVIVGRGNYQYLLYWNAGQSVLSLWTGGSETQHVFTPVVGTWYHIVAINDEFNNKRTIYINGKELSGSSSYVPSSSANVVLRIGDNENFSYHWNGKIENSLIYNRALSAQEIATLYAFPYAMFEEESPYWIPFKAAGGGDQTLTCTAIAGAEAFGTAQLNLTILSAGAIATGEAFGVARLDFTILSADGIASAEAFGSGQIDFTVIAASIATAEAFGTAQLNLTLYASSIGSGEAFGTAVIIREGDVVGIYTGSMTLSMGMGL